MPVFVQWKWNQNTKSFLVVFYFIDDFSQPNLRIKTYKRIKRTIVPVKIQGRDVIREGKEQAIMTWAPSHVEMGLLLELLLYANIINGLSERDKIELKEKLLGLHAVYNEEGDVTYEIDEQVTENFVFYLEFDRKLLKGRPVVMEKYCMPQLCWKYIEYLREVLRLYTSKE